MQQCPGSDRAARGDRRRAPSGGVGSAAQVRNILSVRDWRKVIRRRGGCPGRRDGSCYSATKMVSVVVHPAARVRGRVSIPGDKSISHRYALLAALAGGRSTIAGYAPGADCASTLACLRALGVAVKGPGPGDRGTGRPAVAIDGRGLGRLTRPRAPLDAGNSGTTLRLLSGALAGHPFTSVVSGDASLRRRPMRRIIEPLSRMGARVAGEGDRPPLTISGSRLAGIDFTPPVPSAQVKSAVLLAGLHADVCGAPCQDEAEFGCPDCLPASLSFAVRLVLPALVAPAPRLSGQRAPASPIRYL